MNGHSFYPTLNIRFNIARDKHTYTWLWLFIRLCKTRIFRAQKTFYSVRNHVQWILQNNLHLWQHLRCKKYRQDCPICSSPRRYEDFLIFFPLNIVKCTMCTLQVSKSFFTFVVSSSGLWLHRAQQTPTE